MLTWPDGKTLALSIVINVEEGAEMSVAEGDKRPEPVDELGVAVKAPIRNFVNESNYQYGLRAGAPRIFTLLDRFAFPCTVTAAAISLERAPDLARRITDAGHEVCAHGWRWIHQFGFDESEERAFIDKAAASIASTCGRPPSGWLSRYLHTPNTHRLLLEAGYTYHMDDLSDDVPRWQDVEMADGSKRPIIVVPYALDTNDMKFWTDPGYAPSDWLDYARRTFDWLLLESRVEGPRMMSVGLHLRIIGRPGRIWALEAFLAHVAKADGVWITSRRAIAERFAETVPWPG
ncbi:MAG: polysaccharide deacetylase family protein [Pseudomonadota bacterium]